LAGFFLLYLAPGRRMASVAILFVSSTIGALILWALYGFGAEITKIFAGNHLRLHSLRLTAVPPLEALPLMMLLSLALATFLAWRRTRYFGNWSALLAAAVLLLLRPAQGNSVIWALPFLFVFTGGVFADLLETERRVLVRIMLVSLITVQALAAIWTTVLNANLSG